jgi:hypothetical protein
MKLAVSFFFTKTAEGGQSPQNAGRIGRSLQALFIDRVQTAPADARS